MNNSLSFILLTALLASIEDSFNLDFDVIWIVIAASIFMTSKQSLLFLLYGLCFLCINPFSGIIGAGDIFFICILYPFSNDILLWFYSSVFIAITISILFSNSIIPFLFPVIIGFSIEFFLPILQFS